VKHNITLHLCEDDYISLRDCVAYWIQFHEQRGTHPNRLEKLRDLLREMNKQAREATEKT